jgi:hypothetical protein
MKIWTIILSLVFATSLNGQDKSLYKKLALLQWDIDFEGDKYGVLKDSGEMNYVYDTLIYTYMKGYYLGLKHGKWGVIDRLDSIVLPFDYEFIMPEGHIKDAKEGAFIVQKNGYMGTVNLENEVVIPIRYDAISGWCEYGPDGHYVKRNQKNRTNEAQRGYHYSSRV